MVDLKSYQSKFFAPIKLYRLLLFLMQNRKSVLIFGQNGSDLNLAQYISELAPKNAQIVGNFGKNSITLTFNNSLHSMNFNKHIEFGVHINSIEINHKNHYYIDEVAKFVSPQVNNLGLEPLFEQYLTHDNYGVISKWHIESCSQTLFGNLSKHNYLKMSKIMNGKYGHSYLYYA